MHISKMKHSKYVTKDDVGDGMLVTIDRVGSENVAREDEPREEKYVLYFREDVKPLVLNWTNTMLAARATGSEDTDDWPGKQIVLYNDPTVAFGGKLTGGVRVREVRGKAAANPTQSTERPADSYEETGGGALSDEIPFGPVDRNG